MEGPATAPTAEDRNLEKEDEFPDAKPAASEQNHWFYKFFANDWRRSTKSNQQRMHDSFQLEVLGTGSVLCARSAAYIVVAGKQITLEQGLVKNEATLGLTVFAVAVF